MKKLYQKIKLFFQTKVTPWIKEKVNQLCVITKKFFNEKVLPWVEKNWFQLTNLFLLFIIHLMIRNVPDTGVADFIIKTWILTILVYYLWIKFKKYII